MTLSKAVKISFKLLLFCWLILLAMAKSHAADNANEQIVADMQRLKNDFKLPSLSVAIGIGQQIAFAEAIGYSNIEESIEATKETQYSVGSLAKPMTGIALLKLADLNKIDLEAPVSDFLIDLKHANLYNVKMLAAHVAGIPHETPEREQAEFTQPKDRTSPFEVLSVFKSHDLLFEPSTEFRYSSNGYIALSAVIEAAAQTNFVSFLKSEVWLKLGMVSTELDIANPKTEKEASYYSTIDQQGNYQPATSKRDRSFLFGAGGFISTPSDMVKLAGATYSNTILSESSRQLLREPVRLKSGEENKDRYSVGWRVGSIKLGTKDSKTWTALHHGGVTDNAANAFLLVVPECQAAIAFASNFVPENFWRMRRAAANMLKTLIKPDSCLRSLNS